MRQAETVAYMSVGRFTSGAWQASEAEREARAILAETEPDDLMARHEQYSGETARRGGPVEALAASLAAVLPVLDELEADARAPYGVCDGCDGRPALDEMGHSARTAGAIMTRCVALDASGLCVRAMTIMDGRIPAAIRTAVRGVDVTVRASVAAWCVGGAAVVAAGLHVYVPAAAVAAVVALVAGVAYAALAWLVCALMARV